MKKRIAIATASVLLLSAIGGLAGCGSGDPYANFNETARLYAERSVLLNNSVREHYWWGDETLYMFHAYPNEGGGGSMSVAYAWPYTETVAANWRVATLSKGSKKEISHYYQKTLEGFEYYRAFRTDYTAYCATRSGNIGMAAGDTYYDDNIWISREFLNAYEIFGTKEYLETSEAVAEYIWSGWANDALGGIYWCEQKKNSRNTCSNAPASLLFARLYETTKNEEWLERAKQVYKWTYEKLRDPSDNVYWDNVSNDGKITTWKFTYNTGSMISAGVKLYEITQEEHYLTEAKASAKGAFNHWFKDRGRDYKVIDSVNPWFNVLLLDAWTELYVYDKEATLSYIEAYEANLNHAYEDLSEENLMPADWANGWRRNEDGSVNYSSYQADNNIPGVNVLDMAANAENFGTLAYFYQYIKE